MHLEGLFSLFLLFLLLLLLHPPVLLRLTLLPSHRFPVLSTGWPLAQDQLQLFKTVLFILMPYGVMYQRAYPDLHSEFTRNLALIPELYAPMSLLRVNWITFANLLVTW